MSIAPSASSLARTTARDKQVYPYFREFEQGGLHTRIAGKDIINFSSNDYLGLTNHPKVKEAAKRAVDEYACGLSSSRPQATTTELSSFGVRTVDVVVDEEICCPGFEYHFYDRSEDPPVLCSQIPPGFAGPAAPSDPDRADAAPWLDRLPIIRAFRRSLPRP